MSDKLKMESGSKIKHFGVWIKNTQFLQINRENYAPIDKISSTWSPRIGQIRESYYKTVAEREEDYDDEECRIYSDSWCEEHRKRCLKNFDTNMAFFQILEQENFGKILSELLIINKDIYEVFDLNSCKGVSGIYIMVLDKYKQMYIGQASDIKRRILKHWSTQKPFDRLIFGGVDNSVLSIDSFGALDTTRIYILETLSLDWSEKKIVNYVPSIYRLNRIGGGKPTDVFNFVDALDKMNHRELTSK